MIRKLLTRAAAVGLLAVLGLLANYLLKVLIVLIVLIDGFLRS